MVTDSDNPLLAWDDNGNPVFSSFTTVSQMVSGFSISDKYRIDINGLGEFFDELRVAPFDSDPTVEDTDGDGELDFQDETPLYSLRYGTFLKYINIVEKLAEDEAEIYENEDKYTLGISKWLVASFLRSFNPNYDNLNWDMTGGKLDYGFNAMIKNNYPDVYNYFSNNCTIGYGNEEIDIWHLGATLSAYFYDSTWSDGYGSKYKFAAQFMDEGMIDSLAGWAGDLQSLCIDFYRLADDMEGISVNDFSNDYVYDYVNDALNGEISSNFSPSDLNADIDALIIFCNSDENSLFYDMFTYYKNDYNTRYETFYNYLNTNSDFYALDKYTPNYSEFQNQAQTTIMMYLSKKFLGIVPWPILSTTMNNKSIYCEPTAEMSSGIFYAFYDFIIERI